MGLKQPIKGARKDEQPKKSVATTTSVDDVSVDGDSEPQQRAASASSESDDVHPLNDKVIVWPTLQSAQGGRPSTTNTNRPRGVTHKIKTSDGSMWYLVSVQHAKWMMESKRFGQLEFKERRLKASTVRATSTYVGKVFYISTKMMTKMMTGMTVGNVKCSKDDGPVGLCSHLCDAMVMADNLYRSLALDLEKCKPVSVLTADHRGDRYIWLNVPTVMEKEKIAAMQLRINLLPEKQINVAKYLTLRPNQPFVPYSVHIEKPTGKPAIGKCLDVFAGRSVASFLYERDALLYIDMVIRQFTKDNNDSPVPFPSQLHFPTAADNILKAENEERWKQEQKDFIAEIREAGFQTKRVDNVDKLKKVLARAKELEMRHPQGATGSAGSFEASTLDKDDVSYLRNLVKGLIVKDAKAASQPSCPEKYTVDARAEAIAFGMQQGRGGRVDQLVGDVLRENQRLTGSFVGDGSGSKLTLDFKSGASNQVSPDRIYNDQFHCHYKDGVPTLRLIPLKLQVLFQDNVKEGCSNPAPFGNVHKWVKDEVKRDLNRSVKVIELNDEITTQLSGGGYLRQLVSTCYSHDVRRQNEVEEGRRAGNKGFIPKRLADVEVRNIILAAQLPGRCPVTMLHLDVTGRDPLRKISLDRIVSQGDGGAAMFHEPSNLRPIVRFANVADFGVGTDSAYAMTSSWAKAWLKE
jgi:hypothetical protein